MIVNVWLIYGADGDRVYARTTQPADDQVEVLKKMGFQLFRAEINLPLDQGTPVLPAEAVKA